jgi:hypothetical protein
LSFSSCASFSSSALIAPRSCFNFTSFDFTYSHTRSDTHEAGLTMRPCTDLADLQLSSEQGTEVHKVGRPARELLCGELAL